MINVRVVALDGGIFCLMLAHEVIITNRQSGTVFGNMECVCGMEELMESTEGRVSRIVTLIHYYYAVVSSRG